MVDLKTYEERMEKTIDILKKDFSGLRTGRASVSLLDPVSVEAYGGKVPLNQVSNISVPEARLITVQVWDETLVSSVENSIRNSELGLNPQIDGQLVRLPIPELNEERRTELKKMIKSMGEKCKISIRNIRREANDELKKHLKNKEISEDDVKKNEKIIQDHTDKNINEIDQKVISKEKEIMTI